MRKSGFIPMLEDLPPGPAKANEARQSIRDNKKSNSEVHPNKLYQSQKSNKIELKIKVSSE